MHPQKLFFEFLAVTLGKAYTVHCINIIPTKHILIHLLHLVSPSLCDHKNPVNSDNSEEDRRQIVIIGEGKCSESSTPKIYYEQDNNSA